MAIRGCRDHGNISSLKHTGGLLGLYHLSEDDRFADRYAAARIKQTKVATEPASPDLPNTREPKAETRE